MVAAKVPEFTLHGIIRFDNGLARLGYNIIGTKIKTLPTIKNDKIDIRGNVPDLNSYIIKLRIMKERKTTIQEENFLPKTTTVVLVLAFKSSSYSYNSWFRSAKAVPREKIKQIGII